MRRMRHAARAAAVFAAMTAPGLACERYGCPDQGHEVLNGRLNTADFDGGVGDRFGDAGYVYGGGYVIAYGGAGAGGSAGASASASAAAQASAHVFISTRFITTTHIGGGAHGGWGGHH
jgi:hypothetical protein